MAKKRMIVTDDQLLVDMDLIFSAIDDADGNWQQVEKDMDQYVNMVREMIKDSAKTVVIPKQRMVVTDDQLMIDIDLLFNAIREANGDWEKVADDMQAYLDAVADMVSDDEEDEDENEDFSTPSIIKN